MFQKLIIVAAWASVAVFAYATLTHVGFVYSIYYGLAPLLMLPTMKSDAHVEHAKSTGIAGRFVDRLRSILVAKIARAESDTIELHPHDLNLT
jgi:hypothetical protein